MRRREFLKSTAATTGSVLMLGACGGGNKPTATPATKPGTPAFSNPMFRQWADHALNAARSAGASYADVRIAAYRRESIATREQRVRHTSASEDRGFGIRVLVNGTWGFAASSHIDKDEIAKVAKRAVALARANSKLQREPVRLAPVKAAYQTIWNTPIRRDPFEVSLKEKIDKLLAINAAALKVKGVSFCSSSMGFVREHKFFASTEGSYIEQTLHRCNPSFRVTSVDRKRGSFQTRNSFSDPRGTGYEYVEDYPWEADAQQAGEDAVAKHTAPSVTPGKMDLILHPTNLWLTIHESIGHPTELDRAMGMEANFAGTSFLTLDKYKKLQIAAPVVNFHGEKTHPGSLATCGYDDEGVKTTEWPLVKDGLFVDYQTTREQTHILGSKYSHGTSYAQSWKDVQFQRMPNVNLIPGKKTLRLNDLISSTDDGLLAKGRASYSIDHQRYNFQFSAQTFHRIKNGKIVGMVKDAAYQARTPDFWNACDAICSKEDYYVGGSFYDGKGEPGQVNAVSHGCAPARFRQINVINTARKV